MVIKKNNIVKTIQAKIASSDIGRRMVFGAFWSFVGSGVAKTLVLVSSIICAHILSQKEFGEVGMVRSTVNMFVVFGSAGLGMTATKFIAEYRDINKDFISSIYLLTNVFAVVMGLLLSITILISSEYLANVTLQTPNILIPLKIGAIMLFVTVLNGAQNGILSGLEDFRSIAINNLFGSIAESLFLIFGAYYYGVNGAILGYGVGFFVLYIANKNSIRKNFKREEINVCIKNFRISDLQLIYKFSLPAAFSSIIIVPTYWGAKAMLTRFSGIEEVAMYEVADQWRIIILFIPTALSQIALPILSNTLTSNVSKYWKVLKMNLYLNGGISFITAIIVSISSPIVLRMYGNDYSNYWVLIILAMSTVLSSISNVIGLSISSRSKMWFGFAFNFLWASYFLLFSYLFLNKGMGSLGLSIALLCSYTLHSIIQVFYLKIILPK